MLRAFHIAQAALFALATAIAVGTCCCIHLSHRNTGGAAQAMHRPSDATTAAQRALSPSCCLLPCWACAAGVWQAPLPFPATVQQRIAHELAPDKLAGEPMQLTVRGCIAHIAWSSMGQTCRVWGGVHA